MGRTARTNQVPLAPFSLIDSGPMASSEVYAKVGYKWFTAAPGAEAHSGATLDPKPCPHCGAMVEWALTVKRDPGAPKGIVRYVYARCKDRPDTHRWGFRATTPDAKPTPPPPSTETITVEHTPAVEETPAMPETAPAVTSTSTPGSFDALIGAVIDTKIGTRLKTVEDMALELAKRATTDPDAVAKMVETALASARKVEITIPAMPKASFTGKAHPMLETLLRYIAAGETFFMICGPAASGKSTLAKQIAETLKRKLTAVSINETMTREEILGWRSPNLSSGEVNYTPSAVVEGWERGDVILLDELDRGNPNTLCALNSIEQRVLYVPRAEKEGGSESRMGEGAIVICTANTYGTGASRTYVGANQLDAAFLDRWRVLEVGYDRDLEIMICGGDTIAEVAVKLIEDMRSQADARSLRRPLTTRVARRAVNDVRMKGGDANSLSAAYRDVLKNAGWSGTELSTVGIA
jgi:energy-coupling factor transporter ATP-binding protein EcfA2